VKGNAFRGYEDGARLIVKLLVGATAREREQFTKTGEKPKGARLEPMLAAIKITELTTLDIRNWHKLVVAEVGTYSANRAKQFLNAALRQCRNLNGWQLSCHAAAILIPRKTGRPIVPDAPTTRTRIPNLLNGSANAVHLH
jgi:hypothetical protein